MHSKPLISIITVTYNAENVIGKTMQSLKEQSFADYEHLIIDGASKDKTLDRIKEFGLSRTVIFSEPDKGLYDAMNKGLKRAIGKYVVFLNAGDTFLNSGSLALYANAAVKEPHIIYGDTVLVNEDGKFLDKRHLSAPQFLTKDSFSKGMLICHQAFMVRKDLTTDYDTNYRFSADYDWCVKCIMKADTNKCINLNTPTIAYLSEGLTDQNKFKSLRERFQIMASHYGLLTTVYRHFQFIFRALRRGKL